jgi:hypothetical protein
VVKLRLGGCQNESRKVHEFCGRNMLCTFQNKMKETEETWKW